MTSFPILVVFGRILVFLLPLREEICPFFERYAKIWLQQRQKCEDLSADRCFLQNIPSKHERHGGKGTKGLRIWVEKEVFET